MALPGPYIPDIQTAPIAATPPVTASEVMNVLATQQSMAGQRTAQAIQALRMKDLMDDRQFQEVIAGNWANPLAPQQQPAAPQQQLGPAPGGNPLASGGAPPQPPAPGGGQPPALLNPNTPPDAYNPQTIDKMFLAEQPQAPDDQQFSYSSPKYEVSVPGRPSTQWLQEQVKAGKIAPQVAMQYDLQTQEMKTKQEAVYKQQANDYLGLAKPELDQALEKGDMKKLAGVLEKAKKDMPSNPLVQKQSDMMLDQIKRGVKFGPDGKAEVGVTITPENQAFYQKRWQQLMPDEKPVVGETYTENMVKGQVTDVKQTAAGLKSKTDEQLVHDSLREKLGHEPTATEVLDGINKLKTQRTQTTVNIRTSAAEAAAGKKEHQYDATAKKIGDAIISGKQPPTVQGFGMAKVAPQIKAYLADKGFDLTAAEADWVAVKKHVSTMNGQQQLRLGQAISFTKDSLQIIRKLAKEWDGGQFAPLNSANLSAAKSGAYGTKAASIATRLDSQISDLTSELGTVYKGGNGSTDESLRLAAENLKAKWEESVLSDNIDQIETNLKIRENSMRTSGVSALSNNSLYAPKSRPAGMAPAESKGQLDADGAKRYLQRAGGNKEKARQLAIKDGWKL